MIDTRIFETQNEIIKKQSDIIHTLHQILVQCMSFNDGELTDKINEMDDMVKAVEDDTVAL